MPQKEIYVKKNETVKEILKKLDKTAEKVLLVVDSENRLEGSITDGDIRRYILKGNGLDDTIEDVYHKKPVYIKRKDFTEETVKKILLEKKIELLPIVDESNRVVDFITWDEIFSDEEKRELSLGKLDVPVVIMAGGKGTRLDPFTRILPKPLIPIGDQTILEIIIDNFKRYGIEDYYLTLNYRGEMIKAYFDSVNTDFRLHYVWEEDFWGTAGAIKLVEKQVTDTFIVSNCDIIVRADYEEVVKFHKDRESYLTILSSIQHHKIPYGVIDFKEEGEVVRVMEKPEYSFPINTGVYVLDKRALEYIPGKTVFHMTDLIEKLINNNKRVYTYPVNENDYTDIGQWEEYRKALDKFSMLK